MGAVMQLSLLLFGSVDVTWAGTPVTFATNSVRALLAYLAAELDRPQPREMLAALFWPNQTRAAAYNNLRQTLVRLRKAFPAFSDVASFLNISPQALELKHEAVTSDLARFEDLLAQFAAHGHVADFSNCLVCLANLKEAATLYRGEFLQGLYLEGSEAFEEWLYFKRESFHRQALHLLHLLAQTHEVMGKFEEMRFYAARQLALDPLHEEAHAEMMRSLALSGDRNAALKHYELFRNNLLAELGVEPGDETAAVYDQIRKGTYPPANPPGLPKHNLPAALTPFVGREAELAALRNTGEVRLLTLVGVGGIGKTRLALMLGYTLLSNFADGVFLVSLAALADPATIAPTIAATLGIGVHSGDPHQAVLHSLRDKHLLLILDNFEHLLTGVDIVIDILEAAPHVTIIATSRERLNVRGENLYNLPGLAFEPNAAIADAASMEAVRLFVQSAKRVKPDFTLSAENVADILRICQLVHGMPLGLELAAAWTEILSVKEIAAEVTKSADFLTAEWRDAPQRHRSLRAVFDWSWQLLQEDERQVFKQLSIFRGGFTAEAALAVAGASLRTLLSLQRKSLLSRGEVAVISSWYNIHEALRQFAAEALAAKTGEAAEAGARHSAFYLALAEEAAPKYHSRDQVKWLNYIEREHDNIRAALAWLEQHGNLEAALRLAGALRFFWYVRGYHTVGSEQLMQVLRRLEETGPSLARIQALNDAGYLLWVRGQEHAARELLEEALTQSRLIENQPGTAFALRYLGAVSNAHGEYARATNFLEESLAIWRQLQKENDIGLALMYLGDSMIGLENYERAKTLFLESTRILKHLGNTSVLPYPLRRLGYESHRVGEVARAVTFYAESMALNLEVGDRQGMAASLVGLAAVAAESSNWSGAARLLGAVEALLESVQTQLLPFDRQQRSKILAQVRAQAGQEALDAAFQEGSAFTIEQAVSAASYLITDLTNRNLLGRS